MTHPNNEHKIRSLVNLFETGQLSGSNGFYQEEDLLKLVSYYEDNDDLDQALEAADVGIVQFQYSSTFYLISAKIETRRGNIDTALKFLHKSETLDPSSKETQMLKAEVINMAGNKMNALDVLDKLKSNCTDKVELGEICLSKAGIFEANEMYDEMFEELKKAIMYNHLNQEALEKLWFAVEITNRYKESKSFHKRLLERVPYSIFAWHNLGHAHTCLGEYEEAAKAFEYAFIIDPSFEFAYRDCAEVLIETGQFAQALEIYEEALRRFKMDEDYLLKMGFCYENMGMFADARNKYKKALRSNANNDTLYYRIGKCYLQEDNLKPAKYFLKKALEKNERNEFYACDLANIHYRLDEYTEAAHYFERAVEIAPEESVYWIRLASFYIETDNNEEALAIVEEASNYSPDSQLHFCKVACLIKLGFRKDALNILMNMLVDHYEEHHSLFEFDPNLMNDSEVLETINAFKT
jgi:tetratricopeptide (TPR) repeat protein